jgi:hypothetical protein
MSQKPFTLLGLTGRAEAGKDTVADLLVTHAGFCKLAFADALRAEIAEAYGIDVRMLTQRETKESPMAALALARCGDTGFVGAVLKHTVLPVAEAMASARSPRQIMQLWGTEYRRAQDPDYWVKKLTTRVRYYAQSSLCDLFVVTDVRFANEAALVRRIGAQLWQIKRDSLAAMEGGHSSEVSGDAFEPDAAISNNHDIRHLQQLVLGQWWAYTAGLKSVRVEIEA